VNRWPSHSTTARPLLTVRTTGDTVPSASSTDSLVLTSTCCRTTVAARTRPMARHVRRDGVGRLIAIAVAEGRATRPDVTLSVNGEHGGDLASSQFLHEVGLDYVSCSPFRVPIARLEAGRAAVGDSDGTTDYR
jgi:hypothetical protein